MREFEREARVNAAEPAAVVLRPLPGLAGVLHIGGRLTEAGLRPEERELLSRLPAGRHQDFIRGRRAAAHALDMVGRSGAVVRDGPAPCFPDGVRGAISHCRGAAAAGAATVRDDVPGVGVDVERVGRLSPRTASLVCTRGELARLDCADPAVLATVFSVKESVYKAMFRLDPPRSPLVFHGVEVRLDGNRVGIDDAAGLLQSGETLEGRFYRAGSYVWTIVWVTAQPSRSGV
ncbi:4'-phosphopantetheinyl transferase family protein [Streptomyces griseus]|uniref:4'-phosphopantetheinyl transferase family protein n=1 Tax=Streptomyces griseus TaxID=1911 RepID=UPI0033EBD018